MRFVVNNKNNYPVFPQVFRNFDQITNLVSKKLKLNKKYFFEVHFVSKYMIKKINNCYRNKNYVTDVISFSFFNKPFHNPLLGEIFICYDQAVSQAKCYGKTLVREISFLFLHGLLHLLDYDHQSKSQQQVMFTLQKDILGSLKI